jgi:RNA polymerase-binding transcription factor DksA
MANKKKPAPKKPAAKTAPKKAAKKPLAKPAAKKAVPKKKEKPVSKKIAAKPAPKKTEAVKKPVAQPAAKVVAKAPYKPEVKPATPPPVAVKPLVKKNGAVDPKSLVSIKPTAKPVIKKEPPKPTKVVIPKTTIKSAVKYEPEFTKSVLDSPMYEHNGPTMRYADSDLSEFREIITKKLDAAKKELAYLQGLITRRDEGGDMDEARYMTMEDGSVSMEREQLSQMASRQITFIDHLEKAMMRIENKTYGICRVTGKLIDKARLRAVPHATLSIEAKQMMSK